MKSNLLYLKYVVRHKWFVFLACLRYGLVWRGLKHDWTKFLPSEWFPYVAYFHGEKIPHPVHQIFKDGKLVPKMITPPGVQERFDIAWLHHQKRNSHHWQYWLLTPDNPRPNFWEQSMDGGMTHSFIAGSDGKIAAYVYEYTAEGKSGDVDLTATKRMLADLLNTPVPQKMPLADAKEMIADWMGAGKALGKPKTWEWYAKNKENIFLHPETRAWVEVEMTKLQEEYRLDQKGMAMGFITSSWYDE